MERVTLKNIKFSEWNSEETNCFQGVIYFDNKRVGMCDNDGRGGNTTCRPYDYQKDREKFNECEKYCESLPPIVHEGREGLYDSFEIDSNLENVCDELFNKWLGQKEDKKLEKNYDKGICYGNKYRYQMRGFVMGKKSIPISEVLKDAKGIELVKNLCNKLKSEGHKILNTNLPFEV